MSNCALPPDQITDHALAIDRIANCLANFDIVERRLGCIEGQQVKIRSDKLVHGQIRILAEPIDSIRRKTRSQGRDIDATTLQLGLHSVRFANRARANDWSLRCACPVALIGFEIDDLLNLIVTLEFEWPGTKRMRLLRFVTVFRNHRYRHQVWE